MVVSSFVVPFLHSVHPNKHYLNQLMIIFLTFAPIFVILTISYEGFFYLAFCFMLLIWVCMEHHIYTDTNATSDEKYRPLALSDARISLFFLFLLQSAFFSTGNVASVSSFSLDAVYRLIPVFSPFSQGILLLLKLLIPFAVLSANLGILNRRLNVAPSSLFMVVMAISDVLTLNFFWLVRDEGSWLEIGSSISHFIIVNMFCIFVPGLELVSELFVRGIEVDAPGTKSS